MHLQRTKYSISLNAWVMLLLMRLAYAEHKCVWVHGIVRCQKDPAKNLNVEVRVYDRDGLSIAKIIDPDDLMGVTFTNEDGSFQLDGCGEDIDWIPGIPNNPEPYLQIFHYCNNHKGEIIRLPPFKTFVPKTYEIGIVDLDSPIQVTYAENNTELTV
uniref:Transthyretin-like family protein n=1 Tax=Elaeophora elaphi TaxID=1147741 RepID=A0A0R3RVY3_9BILA